MNNEKPSLKRKGAAVGIVICFVAAIVMVGAFTFNNYNKKTAGEQLAKTEESTITEDESRTTNTNDIVLPKAEGNTSDAETEAQSETEAEDSQNAEDNSAAPTTGSTAQVYFGEDSLLEWPASGAVVLGYSMDKTVYFSTLEQYKYNPAMIISGEVGEMIGASAAGIVTNIEETAQTGQTVTLDMGNGYSAIYGQLTDVPLAVGDYVDQGQTVGYLANPTKYYSVEGPNLYFEVTKDGAPVDPTLFME